MFRRVFYPLPPNFIDFGLKLLPILIGIVAVFMKHNDYVLSGTLLRAAKLLPCCDTFDFIVVGGGSTGSAIASRLSEDPKVKVLLIEAGGNPNPYSRLPLVVPYLLDHPETSWQYRTVPQRFSSFGLVNRQMIWPRGKSLGGSSNINFMIFNKGNARDFNRWAEHTGDNRWRIENVEKYFRKMEDYHGIWESEGGPLRVEGVKFTPGLDYILNAAREIGFDIRDLNADQRQGFSPVDFTQKRGNRFDAYSAYKPHRFRSNLVIYRYTLATKIHFNDELRAIGVTYLRHGLKGYASATREIILSGGAINSPQLLMLSGIGPKEHLEQHGIPTIADLPVGNNLMDHVSGIVGPFLLNQSESFMLHRDVGVGAFYNYLRYGTGPITSPMAVTSVGFASSSLAQSPNWPDLMFTICSIGIYPGFASLIDQIFNFGNRIQRFLAPYEGQDAHFGIVTLGLPKSRGVVRLRNASPTSHPFITPEYYSDPNNHDLRVMLEGIDIITRMYENTTSFQKLGAHLAPSSVPGCEHTPFRSSTYYECLLKTLTATLYHPSGTCAMGKSNDPNSVVDSQLRVINVKGLRVADASIMPFLTNANTNAPSTMIGEMCADMIKEDWEMR